MQVVFSPYISQCSCPYLVEQAGLRSISAHEVQQGLAWGVEIMQRESKAEHEEEQRLEQQQVAQQQQQHETVYSRQYGAH